ncbi:MAG: HAD family phosphatase [Firmicutes bacterium]|nr:HAD family phosphatase [Bacillota bacterium]
MIKNVVFDLGNVLLSYDPRGYLEKKYDDEELINKLYNSVFKSEEWIGLDRGSISQQKAVEILTERHSFGSEVSDIFRDWEEILQPIQGSIEILEELKDRGYSLYVLSNFHLEAFKLVANYDFFNNFDELVISAEINAVKPEPEIYRYLLANYSLSPEETVFIDDMEDNLLAAEDFGIKTIQFKNPVQLRGDLQELGVF